MKSLNYSVLILILGIQIPLFGQWEEKNIATNVALASVDFLDDDLGYVVGGNKIFKTIDGGDSWETSFSADSLVALESVFIISRFRTIAVGLDFETKNSKIFKTEDAGNTWESLRIANSAFLKSLHFPSRNIGYCSGGKGTILKTIDGGNTWQRLTSGTSFDLQSIFFVNDSVGIAVGGAPPASSVILKTQDGGNTWNQINSPTDNNLQSVFFINEDTGYVVGWNGEIIKTENCGDSWAAQNSVSMSGNLEILFTDENTGYIAGGQQPDEPLIQKTLNGGDLWTDISPTISKGLISIDFPSPNIGYAVGSNGTVLKTKSAGVSTSTHDIFDSDNIRVFPNPATNRLQVKSKKNFLITEMKIYDIEGRLINEFVVNALNFDADISNFAPSIYYLEIHSESGKTIRKLVKN